MAGHRTIVGASPAARLAAADAGSSLAVVARCHRRLRGPYTGVDTVLRAVLPEAARRWPALVEHHRMELLYGIPELAELVGPAPRTLAGESSFRERTRFFGSGMIRCMSQGIVSFLLDYARRVRSCGEVAPYLVLDEVDQADPTTQELIALLVRRADPAHLRVVVCVAPGELPEELDQVLARHTERIDAEDGPHADGLPRSAAELVEAYVLGDGTGSDPAELLAYQQADPALRARLHDRRADQLEQASPSRGVRVGALAYHREHGSDPAGAGRLALLAAQRYCVEVGFSAAVVDLGLRGRAVTDPNVDQHDFWEFTHQAAAACIPLNRNSQSMELYLDAIQRFTDPKVHMMTSYSIAMLHTRFLQPRDHDLALRWQNNAVAIASILPDPAERLTFSVFHDNGLALVEMHRGNLARSLELVTSCLARLDAELTDEQWRLHRSQLLYNRARLLTATGRLDEARADYSTLIDLDPYYTDYLSERARIHRSQGDFAAALADYDRAVELAPPFPELYYNRGTARLETGDTEGALADYGYVLEMEPDDSDTRLARAELLLDSEEFDAAEADVAAGLALRPDEPRLLCMRGTIALQRGALTEAFQALSSALALDPGYPAALLNRAVVHYEQSRYRAAVQDLTATLELVGDDPDVLLNRGIAYQAEGQLDLALADFDHALTLPGADVAELEEQRERCRV
ncbi:tetratricopeptide (TPR) repeat protein [Kitasatospora sp. MAA4]|uniref:tetratricopeptide repeat protein n=1 Tax=Kitasatospora sp. MAA4 TaxID=3035093 RepID=UPI0024738014|nr:tetratricopeptide repeat protein [Kitasatospora sp. MAA4]MDH6132336.1 tetratricopeptide (TPR) repeat protein [Kitasatospora sp. MAA4]